MIRSICGVAASVFLLAAVFHVLFKFTNVWINVSPSLPIGIYQGQRIDMVKRGDLVLSCIPDIYAHYAYERGYLMHGRCGGNVAPVGKYVAAAGGDFVEINSKGIHVNGRWLPDTDVQRQDSNGNILVSNQVRKTLDDDEIILANNKLNSFDSRYFGVVSRHSLIYRIEPLWTVG